MKCVAAKLLIACTPVLLVMAAFDANAASIPGDLNADWRVDAADYVFARKLSMSLAPVRTNYGKNASNVGVVIPAGSDIQSYASANPTNTIFYLAPGMTRVTSSIVPKDGDAFVNFSGSVLNGSRLLTSFTSSSGSWYASGQTQEGATHGECLPGYEQCGHPEDVFLDDKPLLHVDSLSKVTAGKWYFDYAADRIYIGDNPSGHKVETSVTEHAFYGTASNVSVYGLTVEKFASQSGESAIQADGSGWVIDHNTSRLNHASGLQGGSYGVIRNNFVHDNGQEGVAASFANNLLVENNEIAFNNFAHYSNEWEAGGSKFWSTTNLTVRGNNVHDNLGAGLWTDTNNTATLYENNIVTNNSGDGIRHEVSYSATIRNNTVKNNGNVQIIVYSSNNTEVYGNTIEIDAPTKDGILVAQDIVGPGILGDYVHHNTTTILPAAAADDVAMSGGALNDGTWPAGAIPFDYNTYYAPNPAAVHWQWPQNGTWSQFLLKGNELHGHLYATGAPKAATVPEPNIVAITMMLLTLLRRRSPTAHRFNMP